jgi:ClpP class serine protease
MANETQIEQQNTAPQNRDIEMFLASGEHLEIYEPFGLSELNRYLEDLQALSLGAKFKDLGISERRRQSGPRLIYLQDANSTTYTFTDRWDLMDGIEAPNSIALLQLRGVMRSTSALSNPGVDSMVSDLRRAYASNKISGIIIESNSGGGESVAGTMLKNAIQERNKPVVGFAHLAASAAYRALSGADEIIAAGESAEFGSIGTMISLDQKVFSKYRSRFADFYGTDAPGKNAEFRSALAGDYKGIQELVDKKTAEFQADIRASRPIRGSESFIRETLSGAVFAANDSKKRGLIDGIGTMSYAVKRVMALTTKY